MRVWGFRDWGLGLRVHGIRSRLANLKLKGMFLLFRFWLGFVCIDWGIARRTSFSEVEIAAVSCWEVFILVQVDLGPFQN